MKIYALAGLATIIIVALIVFPTFQMRKENGSDVRKVWYLISLSCVATIVIALWAMSVGALDAHGAFRGWKGESLGELFGAMFDLGADLKIFGSIVAIIVLPQFLTYVTSGLSGNAAAPMFVDRSLSFFIWSVVKSFALCAGILGALAILGCFESWDKWNWQSSMSMASLGGMTTGLALTLLFLYRDFEKTAEKLREQCPEPLGSKLRAVHRWFTRHSAPKARDHHPTRL